MQLLLHIVSSYAEVTLDMQRMIGMARRNLDKAQEYRPEALAARRSAFYRYIRDKTPGASIAGKTG